MGKRMYNWKAVFFDASVHYAEDLRKLFLYDDPIPTNLIVVNVLATTRSAALTKINRVKNALDCTSDVIYAYILL